MKQGLGFVLFRTVIDRNSLRMAAVKLYSMLSTVITLLATINTPSTVASTAVGDELEFCTLSETERSGIQAAAIAILGGSINSNCSYANVTLASILD